MESFPVRDCKCWTADSTEAERKCTKCILNKNSPFLAAFSTSANAKAAAPAQFTWSYQPAMPGLLQFNAYLNMSIDLAP